MDLPKPKSLLGWGILAAVTAVVKERYTDMTWGDVARVPVKGILDAYDSSKASGWSKAWNVGVEVAKLGVSIGLMVGAGALATAALPAVAATTAGALLITGGSLLVGEGLSRCIVDPVLDKAKLEDAKPAKASEPQSENRAVTSDVKHYASLAGAAVEPVGKPEDRTASMVQNAVINSRPISTPAAPRASA
jgi:hypothetical protein